MLGPRKAKNSIMTNAEEMTENADKMVPARDGDAIKVDSATFQIRIWCLGQGKQRTIMTIDQKMTEYAHKMVPVTEMLLK